jgi:mannose-6-phosphate isomerase
MRQAYVFARCAGLFKSGLGQDLADKAQALLAHTRASGFDASSGHLVYTYGADGRATTVGGELYDLAFLLLACAAAIQRGLEIGDLVTRAESALDGLKAPLGWYETPDQRFPRRQNPHMHLFEAAIAMAEATGAVRYRNIADECLALLRDRFLQDGHLLFEFFDGGLGLVSAAEQGLEPGHMAEWVGLLHVYETTFTTSCGIDLEAFYAATAALSTKDGLVLPDQAHVPGAPEWVKCHAAMASRGAPQARLMLPLLLEELARTWFNPAVAGGWFDQRHLSGALISEIMPASSMYHILEAILAAERAG